MPELTLTPQIMDEMDDDLWHAVRAWLLEEGLWGEPKMTHVHLREGGIEARCFAGLSPVAPRSPHEDRAIWTLRTFKTKNPPPPGLVRWLMAVHHSSAEEDA